MFAYSRQGIDPTIPNMPGIGDHLANSIRAERSRRRWSQAEFAEVIGWPKSSVGDIESGRRKLGLDDLAVICRGLGVPLAELLRGADADDLRALGL